MSEREFCYWLQGFIEIAEAGGQLSNLTVAQTDTIKKHLAMVFVHAIDPTYPNGKKLDAIHTPPDPTLKLDKTKIMRC